MNLKKMKKHLPWLPGAALALTLVGQVAVYYNEQPEIQAHASWAFHPKSLQETKDRAHTIVRAQVVAVEQGEDLVVPAIGEPTGEDRIPTQRITVRVKKVHKGGAREGDTLTRFQTGGTVEDAPAPPAGRGQDTGTERLEAPGGGKDSVKPTDPAPHRHERGANRGRGPRRLVIEGDPSYKAGEEYVLMLQDGPRGLLRTVSPEGRFKVERGGRVKAMVDNEATREVNGKDVAELEKKIKE